MSIVVSRLGTEELSAVEALAVECAAAVDVRAEHARPWAVSWVARAEASGEPAAFLVAWVVADELHLIHIATRPDARQRGAGRALMNRMIDHAREKKSRLLLLEVRRSNRAAIRLYRACGFSAIGVRRKYYQDGEDAIEMTLTLDTTTGVVKPARDEVELATEAR